MLSIETVKPEDFAETAELHKAYLTLGLFPRLGRSFLRHYQESFARSPHGIALVARSDDGVVGALFGTTSNAAHYRWVVRNCGLELALAGGSALVTQPQLAWDFASTRAGRYMRAISRRVMPSEPASDDVASPPLPVLSHIVTATAARRQGVGRKLVERFKALAGAEGARSAVLVTEEGGKGAPFFERLGCTMEDYRFGQDGALVRQYRMKLDDSYADETMDRMRLGATAAYARAAALRARAGFDAARPG